MIHNETVTVSVGRNIGQHGEPMSMAAWQDLTARVVTIGRANGMIYFAGFGDGTYLGTAEDSFTIVAGIGVHNLQRVRREIAALCEPFGQDAIAVSVGSTELVRSWSA